MQMVGGGMSSCVWQGTPGQSLAAAVRGHGARCESMTGAKTSHWLQAEPNTVGKRLLGNSGANCARRATHNGHSRAFNA
jgi:hypothetical protein